MKTSLANSLGAALGLSILLNANAADSDKLQPASSFGAALRVHSLSGNPISFSALTHGNGIWVAASGDTIFTSTDSTHWSSSRPFPDVQVRGLAFDGNQFVAVGAAGLILTSKDGHRWIRTGSRHSVGLKAVAAGPDGFVAVGCGVILTSPDGRHWSRASVGSRADSVSSVVWGDDRWMAVGKAGLMLTSMDGRHWTQSDGVTTANLHSVHYAQDQFIAVGSDGVDGVIWFSKADLPWIKWKPSP